MLGAKVRALSSSDFRLASFSSFFYKNSCIRSSIVAPLAVTSVIPDLSVVFVFCFWRVGAGFPLKEVEDMLCFSAIMDSSKRCYSFYSFYFEYLAIRDSILSISYCSGTFLDDF